MAQVVDRRAPGGLAGLLGGIVRPGSGGRSKDQLAQMALQDQRSMLEIQAAQQQLQQQNVAFAASVQDRARQIQFEDVQRQKQDRLDNLKLNAAELGVQDTKVLGEVEPFGALLGQKSLPPAALQQLQAAQGTYKRLGTDAARKLLVETTLEDVDKAIATDRLEAFKAGVADRHSRGAYGEDDAAAAGLDQLTQMADAAMTMEPAQRRQLMLQMGQADLKLRSSLAESGSKLSKKQRELAFAQTQIAGLPPGEAADKAEQALHAFQHELIDTPQLFKLIQEAQFPDPTKAAKGAPKPAAELYVEAAKIAKSMFEGSAVPNSKTLMDMTERVFERLSGLQEQRSPLPFEQQPQNGQAQRGGNAGPTPATHAPVPAATPAQTMQSVQKAQELTAPKDKAGALKQAEEAAKAGASDAELIKILKAAGIDPTAPASSLDEPQPKRKRRTTERVGPNV